jgi:hypothetical protein
MIQVRQAKDIIDMKSSISYLGRHVDGTLKVNDKEEER